MILPASFKQTIENTFGERGRLFLESLPGLVAEAAHRWQLTDIQTAPGLSYNFVAFARRLGSDVVLKVGVLDPELTSEIASLRIFDGRGAVRLLDADAEHGMLLLERLRPGQLLATLEDDQQATHIAADVMLSLWRPAPSEPALIRLSDWFKGLEKLRGRFDGGTGPFPQDLVERAEAYARTLFAEPFVPTLIHGDLHHFNILSSGRGWLAIDPKGVIGPAAYEVGPFLLNPWVVNGLRAETAQLIEKRIPILAERLRLEPDRLCRWGLAYAVLSAWWSFEGNEDWEPAIQIARILASLEP